MEHVFANGFLSVSGFVLNPTQFGVDDGTTEIDMLKMGDTAGHTRLALKQQSITVTLIQDYGVGKAHQVLTAALAASRAGIPVAVIVRPDAAVASPANPQWTGNLILPAYSGIPSVSAHDKGTVSVTFKTAGAALTYSEA